MMPLFHGLRNALVILILSGLTAWSPSALAQAPMREDPARVIGFAHRLLSKGLFYRAVTEYRAFLHLFPGHPRSGEAWYFLGKTYAKTGQWDPAIQSFRRAMLVGPPESTWSQSAALALGDTLIQSGRPDLCATVMEEIARSPKWRDIRNRALFRAAWGWIHDRNWNEALRVLGEIDPADPLQVPTEGLRREILERLPDLSRRNPWLAGALAAVVPGSGHLYAGRPKEAATSFLLNAAFIAGAVFAIREGYPVTGGILSFFELSWYLGGIRTAYKGAVRYNRERVNAWLRAIGANPDYAAQPP